MFQEKIEVSEGLKTFMQGLIDYAGLFPPARLPLDQALINFSRYRSQDEHWMLARFIIPAGRLVELEGHGPFAAASPHPFSVLGRGGSTADKFLDNLNQDLADIDAFRTAHGTAVQADMYEVRLPTALLSDGFALSGLLAQAGARLQENGLRPFFEATLDASWRSTLETAVQALAAYNEHTPAQAGLKLRCGGPDAAAFPSQYQVAHVIALCRDARLPLKATAGLHHPIRHFNREIQTKMHGFINIFVAGILARVHGLPEHEIAAIVADENPTNFTFDDGGLAWLDRPATLADIQAAREAAMISYGSCSFEEPREDLQVLGWL